MRTLSLVGALALVLTPLPALAAATAGATRPPRILAERALLVWDPSRTSEHLLIAAELEPAAGPVAMIVPTPIVPAVDPLPEDPSTALNRLFGVHAAKADVEVVAKVAAKGEAPTATVLQAADAGALGGWLERNGLAAHPALTEFARAYGAKAYHYVALRLADAQADEPRSLPWTAISFIAPGPYYPIATPEPSFDENSRLEIYTLSPELLALTVDERFDTGVAALLSRDEVAAALGETWMRAFDIEAEGPDLWLQRFEPKRTAIGREDGIFVRVPTPAKKTVHEEASLLPPNGKRLVAFLAVAAFAFVVTWLASWEGRSARRLSG